jgi:hypothetical protein
MNLHDFSWLKVHLGLSYLVVDQFSSLLKDSNFLTILRCWGILSFNIGVLIVFFFVGVVFVCFFFYGCFLCVVALCLDCEFLIMCISHTCLYSKFFLSLLCIYTI